MIRRLLLLVLLVGQLGLVGVPAAMAGPVDEAPPATIRVCRSNGQVETVSFKDYVSVVLPVEFYSSWPTETLRAGAVVIKSYAWYFVRNPISDRCDLGDTTRYQVYAPEKQRRTAATDQAVEDTWHLRMWDPKRQEVAFAQYCSAGCRTHARNAGAGRYMDQDEAFTFGKQGWTHLELLHHFYRNLPMTLTSWVDGLGMTTDQELMNFREPPPVTLALTGVSPGDARVRVAAIAICTVEGDRVSRVLDVVHPRSGQDGATVAHFANLSALASCEDQEATVHFQLIVQGHVARTVVIHAWRQWESADEREVERLGDADGPVLSSVLVSEQTFPSLPVERDDAGLTIPPGQDEEPVDGLATHAVIARADRFADALGATALAGTDAPLLLHPAGDGQRLNKRVASELERMLEPGATVHVVGGPNAIGPAVESDLRDLGFDVDRTAGTNRIDTAIAVADDVVERNGSNGRVVLARGFPDGTAGWADAVAVAPWAARTGTPILLTATSTLDPGVKAWIDDPANDIFEVIVIGGPKAIGTATVDGLEGVAVTRVAGNRRSATALAVADQLWGTRGAPTAQAVVTQNVYDDEGWPFAVVGAIPAARADAAAVSVWSQVPPTTTGLWLDANPDVPALVVGGPTAVSPDVESAIAGA